MVKTDQDKTKESKGWMDDIDLESVKKVSELNILPTLKVNYDKVNNISDVYNVIVLGLPTLTMFADNNQYFVMLIEHNEVIYQFNCNGKSFRFQLATLIEKKFKGIPDNLIGHTIQISKTMANINTPAFKGKAEVYQVSLIQ